MPVQDSERKTQTEPVIEDKEEKQRQQNAENEEKNISSGKLLPFLKSKAEYHSGRVDNLTIKIADQSDKIEKHTSKLEYFQAKVEKLEDMNKMLKTFGNKPFARKLIESNQRKIETIQKEKIPARKEKIKVCRQKLEKFTVKKDTISHKLNRVLALNDTIKSFSIGLSKERREAFSDAMDRLNSSQIDCMNDKKSSLINKKNELFEIYNSPETSMVDKYKIQGEIKAVAEKISVVESKIHKLTKSKVDFVKQPERIVDKSMEKTEKQLDEMTNNGEITVPKLSETAIETAKNNSLEKVEELLEDDADMIDGIINNGRKNDTELKKNELSESIKSMQKLIENPYVSQDMKELAEKNIQSMQADIDALEQQKRIREQEQQSREETKENSSPIQENSSPIQYKSEKDFINDLYRQGKVQITNDGGYKVNPEYYSNLSRNDRHIEPMTGIQAGIVMQALTFAGIEFSASTRGNDNVGITVANKDIPALNEIMKNSIGRCADFARSEISKDKPKQFFHKDAKVLQTVNPDYYKSLTRSTRVTSVETVANARKIVRGLMDRNLPYSAVIRSDDTAAITVSKDNEKDFKEISKAVKGENSRKLVNPEFFKSLPKYKRQTERMPQQQAEKKIAELEQKGIPHSAVLDGEKSAVTVERKSKPSYFSRGKLKSSAQRINGQNTGKSRQVEQTRENNGR